MRSKEAFDKLIQQYSFTSVLDIGGGAGSYKNLFEAAGKRVYTSDFINATFKGDFNTYDFGSQKFDCIWCAHTLEHQLNINYFLKKINSLLIEKGVLAISVPPLKHEIVGGHVSLWNAGLLLYNLILAGFNCKNAAIKSYGYDISIILIKDEIKELPGLVYDYGDIETLAQYFPTSLNARQAFDGNIKELNWSYS